MAEAPVVEKVARQAKKIYDKPWVRQELFTPTDKMERKGRTYEERTESLAWVVETADNTKRKNRENSDSIRVDSERSTADIVT